MAKTEPVRVGIAGIGRAGGGMHCRELKGREKKFQIVAACDPIKERRDRMAHEYGCSAYRHIEDLISDPDVELVDVANRTPDHAPDAVSALKAGMHVFLEKPIAVSYAEARRLKGAASRSKGRLFVRHNSRFDPAFQHIREIIDSGILGNVFEIKLRRNRYDRRGDWQTLTRCGGGLLLNWGPHIIDHGLRFLKSPVAEVWGDLKRVAALGDAEDHFRIIMKGKNGMVIDIEVSGGAAFSEPLYTVFGTKGALVSEGSTIQIRYLDPKQKLSRRRATAGTRGVGSGLGSSETLKWIKKTITVNPKKKSRPDMIWDYMYDSIRKGKEFPITLDEALEVMRIISMVKRGTVFEQ